MSTDTRPQYITAKLSYDALGNMRTHNIPRTSAKQRNLHVPGPQVYCMTQHQLIRTIPRAAASAPAPGPVDPDAAAARASLLFGQNGYLYASWADCIKVCDGALLLVGCLVW